MAFGFDDLFFLLASAASANQLVNPPQGPENKLGGAATGGVPRGVSPFEQFVPQPGATGEAPVAGLDLSAQSAAIDEAAKVLAAQGPPPTVALEPAKVPNPPPQVGAAGTPQPGPIPPPTPPADPGKPPASIGEILAASPQAIAAVANLLGLNQQEGGTRPAPVAGGGLGSVVSGFQLPQTPDIGQLLAQIPRLR